jgi:iron(III) transport system permease protein
MLVGKATDVHSLIEQDGRWTYGLAILLIAALAFLPALALMKTAFAPNGTFNPSDALAEMGRPIALRAAWNSIEMGLLSALLSLLIGGFAALLIGVSDMNGKRMFAFLFTMSMLIAPQVAALAFKTLAGPASPLLKMLGLAPPPGSSNPLLGRFGIVMVLGFHHAPLVMLTLLAGLKTIPHSLIESAELDGAGPVELSWRVVLPCLRGHFVAATLLAFVASLGNFGIPALLGLPVNFVTLPTLIYRQLASFGPDILADVAALSVMVAVIAGFAIVLSALILTGRAPPLERDQSIRPYWHLGRLRGLVQGLAMLLVLIALILPLASLVASSLVPAYGMNLSLKTLTFRAFHEILFKQTATLEAFRNSFLLAASAAILLAILAVPVSYALERLAKRTRSVLAFLIELPFALPGIVVAIAAILLFLKPLPGLGFSLYGTPWIILFAYLSRFLSLAIKPVSATLAQLDQSVEEAASLCGAGPIRRFWSIILPMVLPATLTGGVFVFLSAFNELTVSALLWGPGTRTLGVVLFGLEEAGLTTEASALGVLTILIVASLMLLIDRLGHFLPPGVIPWQMDKQR